MTVNVQEAPAATLMPVAVSVEVPEIDELPPQNPVWVPEVLTRPDIMAPRSSVNPSPLTSTTDAVLSIVKVRETVPPCSTEAAENALLQLVLGNAFADAGVAKARAKKETMRAKKRQRTANTAMR